MRGCRRCWRSKVRCKGGATQFDTKDTDPDVVDRFALEHIDEWTTNKSVRVAHSGAITGRKRAGVFAEAAMTVVVSAGWDTIDTKARVKRSAV